MRACRACGLEHSSMVGCEVAKALLGKLKVVHRDGVPLKDGEPISVEVKPLAEKKPLATGLNRLYKEVPAEPAEVVLVGWDGVERRKDPCAVCEARKAKDAARVKRWRAKK